MISKTSFFIILSLFISQLPVYCAQDPAEQLNDIDSDDYPPNSDDSYNIEDLALVKETVNSTTYNGNTIIKFVDGIQYVYKKDPNTGVITLVYTEHPGSSIFSNLSINEEPGYSNLNDSSAEINHNSEDEVNAEIHNESEDDDEKDDRLII